MGRTTTLGRRPYSPKDADTKLGIDRRASLTADVDESKPQFPRFKPRIGTQYQSKVPRLLKGRDESTASSRPKPDQMSTEIHHLTMLEVQEARGGRKLESLDLPEPLGETSSPSAVVGCSPGYGSRLAPRGGLRVHRPHDQMNNFLSFAQPLILSLEAKPVTLGATSSEFWKLQLSRLYNDEDDSKRRDKHNSSPSSPSPPKRGRPSKQRGVKRKLKQESQEEEKKASWELLMTTTTTSFTGAAKTPLQLFVAEEDERALEYLQLRHIREFESARISAMVDLTSGRAFKARKCFERQWHKDFARQLPADLPKLWRERYEWSEKSSTMSGDLREETKAAYPFQWKESKSKPLDHGADTTILSLRSQANLDETEDEDFKRAWSSVLAFGQTLEQEMKGSCGEKGRKKPLLSCILSFIDHVCSLPPPEDVFGSRHVFVDEISKCMSGILDHVCNARDMQAKLFDFLYDEKKEGVDIGSFSKLLDEADRTISIQLDESEIWHRTLQTVSVWQSQLDSILEKHDDDKDISVADVYDLEAAEALLEQGRSHGIPSRSLVQLEAKVETAYQLRDRICDWQKIAAEGAKESIKFVAALVRDANRLKLSFPEAIQLLSVHRDAESWVDRANIAIRSRISVSEIRSLVHRASEMPLELSEYTDKLLARVRIAEDWFEGFKRVVHGDSAPGDEENMLLWMSCMREALDNGKQAALHEMASEGSRIPVEIDVVKMLQVELDAKNWSLKAKKWIPDDSLGESNSSKRGRLEDLRDHVEKADALRDKLILSDEDKEKWRLDGEIELKAIVTAADAWFEKYKPFIEGDNRRSNGRACVSLPCLRQIVGDGNAIFANIGSATGKMSKMLSQAESWYEKHKTLIDRCMQQNTYVTIPELEAAVKDALSDVAIDLDEAVELKILKEKVEAWFDRSLAAAPKRSKRPGKGRAKNRHTVAELEGLIREGAELPVDTTSDISRLTEQVRSVQSWKAQAHQELAEIAAAFRTLRDSINAAHGSPADFSRKLPTGEEASNAANGGYSHDKTDYMDIDDEAGEEKKVADDSSQTDTASTTDSEHETAHLAEKGLGRCNVHKLIASLLKTSKLNGVGTAEEETAIVLENIARWSIKSLKYLDSSKELFDKRFFGAFDRFVSEGNDFLKLKQNDFSIKLEDEKLKEDLVLSCCGVLFDQLSRLDVLYRDRERFVTWCSQAKEILQSGNRMSVDMLKDLSKQSLDFPPVTDLVQKIRLLEAKATQWARSAKARLDGKDKMSMLDAKTLLDEAEKLNISCDESKLLRSAIRSAKGFANRVKRSKLDEGATHIDDVKELLDEYESLQLAMPDEVAKLRQAMKSYCICRRPYAGFMIGCDTCDEWYHGPCIGMSEARADRFNKFICIRCCTARMYKASAASIASLIRKWTNSRERKKARQVEAQKHQRKVRKETKDIEKLQAEILELEKWLRSTNEMALQDTKDESHLDCSRGEPVPEVSAGSSSTHVDCCIQETNRNDIQSVQIPEEVDITKHDAPEENLDIEADVEAPASVEDAKSKMEMAVNARQMCEDRLFVLAKQAALRLAIERKEDQSSECLKRWFVRVRSLVLAPSTEVRAILSRPLEDGSLSLPMLKLLADARKLGIYGISDVDATINAFWCLSWSLRAAAILSRRPSLAEMRSLHAQSISLALPDEKALRMMKSLIQRAAGWQGKVIQALAPKPGEMKPICVEILKDLAEEGENIPLKLPEESMLETAIDDKGARHCVCGGPSDGSVMLSCDKCDRWFHGRCMGITKEDSEALSSWICHPCLGQPRPQVAFQQSPTLVTDCDSEIEDFSPTTAAKDQPSWPPYGLRDSQEALDALGDCCAIPDDVDDLGSEISGNIPSEIVGEVEQTRAQQSGQSDGDLLIATNFSTTPAGNVPAEVTLKPSSVDDEQTEERSKNDQVGSGGEDVMDQAKASGYGTTTGSRIAAFSSFPESSGQGKSIPDAEAAAALEMLSTADKAKLLTPECCHSIAVSLDANHSDSGSPNFDCTCQNMQETLHEDTAIAGNFPVSAHHLHEDLSSQELDPRSTENMSADEMRLGPVADMMVECETRHFDAIGTSV